MSTLLVETLGTELSQEWMFYLNKTYQVVGFYPYLYMQNAPAGGLLFQFLKGAEVVYELDITADDIKAALQTTNDHAHLWFPFVPQTPILLKKGLYTARIEAIGGYSETDESFFGWVREHTDAYNECDYTPSTDLERPLAMKIKQLRQGILK